MSRTSQKTVEGILATATKDLRPLGDRQVRPSRSGYSHFTTTQGEEVRWGHAAAQFLIRAGLPLQGKVARGIADLALTRPLGTKGRKRGPAIFTEDIAEYFGLDPQENGETLRARLRGASYRESRENRAAAQAANKKKVARAKKK